MSFLFLVPRGASVRAACFVLLYLPTLVVGQSASKQPPHSSSFKRISMPTEAEVLHQLEKQAVPIDIQAKSDYLKKLVESVRPAEATDKQDTEVRRREAPVHTLGMLKEHADFQGLPFNELSKCTKSQTLARVTGRVSNSVKLSLALRHENEDVVLESLREAAAMASLHQLVTLMQMFQPQAAGVRKKLVEMLAEWDDPQSSSLLAQRAIFDLSHEVRAAAVEVLRERPAQDYRPTLLAGLRYPWRPVAEHAAEALVALGDRSATADLVNLLDKPDPRRPHKDERQQTVVRELVAVNHLRNCLLCHAPSFDESDSMRGVVPGVGIPLPPRYYTSGSLESVFARADVTYLKQDFSVFQPVAKAGSWPALQRFDYLVRNREATATEIADRREDVDYPQREAVLFALRELTGEDRGSSSAAWRSRPVLTRITIKRE